MTDKQEIKHAIDNWNDKNYLLNGMLYVLNSSFGHYKYRLNLKEFDWIRVKFNLIQVGCEFRSKDWIEQRAIEIDEINLALMNEITENINEKDLLFKSVLQNIK